MYRSGFSRDHPWAHRPPWEPPEAPQTPVCLTQGPPDSCGPTRGDPIVARGDPRRPPGGPRRLAGTTNRPPDTV
ncbi:hypothetical protein FKM82_011995 [Ascaphus truei]